jgi:hypothetical protein
MFNGGAEPVALLSELAGYDLGENAINGFDCKLLLFPRSYLFTDKLLSNSPYDLAGMKLMWAIQVSLVIRRVTVSSFVARLLYS